MQSINTKQLRYFHQRGIALIMSLVILLILTLLGVTSMNTSNLQLLMTGNSQYQMIALNAAEDVISKAQEQIKGFVGNNGTNTPAIGTGYYNSGTPEDISTINWDGTNVMSVAGTDSKYIIEFLKTQTLNSSSKAWRQDRGIAGDSVSVFRITARTSAPRGAKRYVQAIYVTIDSP